jgi:rRNA small subunit pseudouridine methyltransferase Nep1
MLHVVLADSELEQVPPEIANHKIIRWQARRRGRRPTELILNSSYHHRAMLGLPERERRGRPDIVHSCLLQALDSPLNHERLLSVHVHTRGNKVIRVDPSVSLPRTYSRFEGLIEQLFLLKAVPPEKPLLRLESMGIAELLEELAPAKIITFSERGERRKLHELFEKAEDEVCAVIGGFPHGDFISPVERLADEVVSLYPEPLTAPVVVSRVITAYEQRKGLL